jgi:1-acyl-sn-glycerol-3-phosphate acyltransferase
MTYARSLAFNLLFFLGGGLFLLALIPGLLLPRHAIIRFPAIWHGFVLWALRTTCGITHEIRGREHLPAGACIVAAKHQSAWDTMILPIVLDDAAFVLKRQLLRIPVYGWYLRKLDNLPVDREGGARALRAMVADGHRILAQGRPIVIFPEGTRTALDERRPYHPGVAALYTQSNVPVVPAALNSGLFWGRRAFVKRPGRIVLEFLPPIAPGLPRKAFMRELEARIETASERLRAEART